MGRQKEQENRFSAEFNQQLRNGDEEAWNYLVDSQQQRLVNYACSLGATRENALDAIQKVYLYLWKTKEDNILPDGNIVFLLHLAVKRKLLDQGRQVTRRGEVNLSEYDPDETGYDHTNNLISPAPSVERQVSARMKLTRVKEELQQFPHDQAQALWASATGYSGQEIATSTDTNPSTVRAQIRRAREKLAALVKKD